MATSGVATFVFLLLFTFTRGIPSSIGQKEVYDEVRQLLALTSNGLPNPVSFSFSYINLINEIN